MAAVSDFFSLGSVVWCRTCYNKEIEGEVLAFDAPTKVLILKCAPTIGDPKLNDIHFVNLSLVSELQVKKEVNNVPEAPQSLNLQRLNTRVRNQVDKKKRKFQAISANVSSEGQSLFIAISKTIPEVRWKDSDIVVFSGVTISPPYQLENIRGNKTNGDYKYVRKIVEKHIKDLALNNQSPPVCQNNTSQ
ncbi:unnamed protein product [Phyllotreta striolata]|uniref:AD domain-containing protein n=1 Tax=Phyllotreta striolata TaxID=444603 RepID=A0A9N9XS17_PHYSR|nr:unnamed protein product [Phyllotreta striolata]